MIHWEFDGTREELKGFNEAHELIFQCVARGYAQNMTFFHDGRCPPGTYELDTPMTNYPPVPSEGAFFVPLCDPNGLWVLTGVLVSAFMEEVQTLPTRLLRFRDGKQRWVAFVYRIATWNSSHVTFIATIYSPLHGEERSSTMNPIIKTLITTVTGLLAPVVLGALSHPTGGLLAALSSNPTYALAWGALTLLAHNVLESYVPAANPPSPAPSSIVRK